MFAAVGAQRDSIFIQVQAAGTSEQVVVDGVALAQAAAVAVDTVRGADCDDLEAVALAQAQILVEAAATATAQGTIVAASTGNAYGFAETSVTAVSSATVIAQAIAVACF
eukprot:TRINITY_DN102_c0_g1_i1.p2 TRINITY_DN102_c0_g1~~TRINITY_DN102_c0_g1_i1.p2  ORF type:complete len:110 (-),score=21.16 TRINITY_DN102_c0_g1_i1:194-523(-)